METREKSKRAKYVPPEELRARILKVRRRYFISRSDDYEKPFIDDEAEIEIDAVIEDIPRSCRCNLTNRAIEALRVR